MTSRSLPPFTRRLLAAREMAGISQAELSRRCGLSKSHLSQMERGANENPSLDSLVRLSRGLGVPIDYLAGLEPAPVSRDKIAAGLAALEDEDMELAIDFIDLLRRRRGEG